MARKDGGKSEGIVLYPSRSPSLGWKPTPLAPLVRGVKAMRPTRGFSTAPKNEGLFYNHVIPANAGINADEKFIGSSQPCGCHQHAPE